ncbi:hypothetical protein LguiB_029524 [Lonicera macranthoides]
MANNTLYSFLPEILIILVVVLSATIFVTVYHCIRIGWCNRPDNTRPHQRPAFMFRHEQAASNIENSINELIPARKYKKNLGLAWDGGGVCAICLCDFEEGEELRTLPECLHSFHAPCIDMWLFSHSDCPLCRNQNMPL